MSPDLTVWQRMQELIQLEETVKEAMLGEKEPPYELRILHNRVKKELRFATQRWHQQLYDSNMIGA